MLPAEATMPDPTPPRVLVRAAERGAAGDFPEQSFRHPLNPRSELHGYMLSRLCGLSRAGVSLVRVPPGKESYVFHAHLSEEEWMFVLSGTGLLELGEEELPVGPGDFAGFAPGGPGHNLRNTGAADLVYLSGGESRDLEVADFPRLGKRAVRTAKGMTLYPLAAGEPLSRGRT
jgi:uncharacterized cupin superfamily protein